VRGVGLAPGDLITVTYLKEGFERQPFRVVKLAPAKNYQTVSVTAQWHDDAWYTTGGANTLGGRRREGAEIGLPRPLVGSVIDANNIEQFGIAETAIESADGSFGVDLTVSFVPPAIPAATSAAIPLVSLSPQIAPTGGTVAADQILYYAITALDAGGAESGLSFVVRAKIPSGTNTNEITLTGLSFSPGTASFHVYRGTNPNQLLRIASSVAVAGTYTDAGAMAQLVGPPDRNYDHANFYWRWELQPEAAAEIASATTIGNSALGMPPDEFKGATVRVTRGAGALQERAVSGNDGTTLTVSPAWTVTPDNTSFFAVADSTWNFGAVGTVSPVHVQVPNRSGETVEISGRSANARDQESLYELNPLTSWQIGGAGSGGTDDDVPPLPMFGLDPGGQGSVELLGIAFATLANTHTVSAGTLGLFYWNELGSPSTVALNSAISSTDTTLTLTVASPAELGNLVQLESEVMTVIDVQSGGLTLTVARASHGSAAVAHAAATLVYTLTRAITTVPFVKGFFGSPASVIYVHSMFLPDVRIAAAEFYATNAVGNSPVKGIAFGAMADQGLRTFSGGQISIQVDGYLAIETDAAPPFVIEDSHAPRDIFAVVREAPSGGAIQLQVRQNSTVYCTLTIADGQTLSNVIDGFGMPPLASSAQVSLDVLAVPGAANTLPGRDLTVTIRL